MNYQSATLPENAELAGSTQFMTQDTVVPGLLKKHLAPKGKWGYLVVETGSLQFIWEDDAENVLDAGPDHPIVIYPERFHHVVITGAVQFRVEFYRVEKTREGSGLQGERPGSAFIEKE